MKYCWKVLLRKEVIVGPRKRHNTWIWKSKCTILFLGKCCVIFLNKWRYSRKGVSRCSCFQRLYIEIWVFLGFGDVHVCRLIFLMDFVYVLGIAFSLPWLHHVKFNNCRTSSRLPTNQFHNTNMMYVLWNLYIGLLLGHINLHVISLKDFMYQVRIYTTTNQDSRNEKLIEGDSHYRCDISFPNINTSYLFK